MPVNIVHLSPHFPPRFHFFTTRLAARGARVLGITDQHPSQLSPELRHALDDHRPVGSLHHTEAVVAAVRDLARVHGPIHRIESHLETWLELEAMVREALDIPGLDPARLRVLKHKSLMKQVFQRAGVEVAPAALLADPEAARALVEEVGFPVIVKPDSGVGAQETLRLESVAEFEEVLARPDRDRFLLEPCIEGEIVTFDGLAGPEGQILFSTSHRMSADIRRIGAEALDFYYWNERVLPPDLEAAGRAVVAAMQLPEKFFHIEFFREPSGRLLGLEINIRPPGGFTTDMFNFAHDIDVYDLWARVVAQGLDAFEHDRPYHCAHVSRRDRYRYRFDHRQVLEMLGDDLCMVQRLNPLYAQLMGESAYILRTPDEDRLHQLTAAIHARA